MPWYSLLVVAVLMLLAWCWQGRSKNAGVVDVVWAVTISLQAIFYALTGTGSWQLKLLIGLIMGGWYLRLGIHLARRVFSESEDGRYQYLRQYWGDRAHVYHFFFFQFQAVLAWLFALPAWVVAGGVIDGLAWNHYAAIAIVAVSIIGVTVADWQLAAFRSKPENRSIVCERGLWYYSRHPNYFFEWLHWFSYPLLAIGITGGIWLWLAPVTMLLFIYVITGIPYTEQQAIRSRGERYIEYQKTTSAFVPWRKNCGSD